MMMMMTELPVTLREVVYQGDNTGEVSEEGMDRYLGGDTDSVHSMSQSDNVSQEEARNIDNTGYQTTGSVSHEAIELQAIVQVHQPPNTDGDTTEVSEEGMERELGRETSSIHSIARSDNEEATNIENDEINNTGYQTTGSVGHEAIELQAIAQVHQQPNTDTEGSDAL